MQLQCGTKERVFVCGGGHQGLSMAAYLSLHGVDVTLWNRTPENIKEVIETGEIACDGVIQGTGKVLKASSNMEEVLSDFIMVTTPSSAHKDIAKRLAPYMDSRKTVVLNPGRTFGAVEFIETLKECGVKEMPAVAETQTIVFTCRRSSANNATIFALKDGVKIASVSGCDISSILSQMPNCLQPYFEKTTSIALTSLTNVGMILHCAPVLMNIGWIETNAVDFKYYYDGISPSIGHYLEKLDAERITVARAMGYQIESLTDWLRRTYHVSGNTIFECIQNNQAYKEIDAPKTIQTRYLLEDVPNGLVPIEYLGGQLGVPTPNITTIIDLACSVMERDFRSSGRRFPLATIQQYL